MKSEETMGIEENFEATENLVVNTMEVKREEVKTEFWSNSSPGNVAEDSGGELNSGIMMGNENSGICVEFYANLDSECVVEGVSLEIEADSYLNIGGTKEEDKQLVDVVEEGTKLKEENVGEENNMDINVEEYLNLDNEGVMEDENAQVVRDNWEMNGEGIEDEERLVTGEKKQLTPNSESFAEDKSLDAYLESNVILDTVGPEGTTNFDVAVKDSISECVRGDNDCSMKEDGDVDGELNKDESDNYKVNHHADLAVVSAEKISTEEEASAAVMNDMKGNAHLDNIASIKEDDIEKERKRGMKVICKKMKVRLRIANPNFTVWLLKGAFGRLKIWKHSKRRSRKYIQIHGRSNNPKYESKLPKKPGCNESKDSEKRGQTAENMRVVQESESAHAGKSKQINTISAISEGCWAGLPSKQQRRNNKRKRAPSEKNLQGKETSHAFVKRRSFKPRGNLQGSQSSAFRNKGNKSCCIAGPAIDADFVRYSISHATDYAVSTSNYSGTAYSSMSGSEQHRSDLEPHAGYLEPIAGFVERHHTRYLEPAVSNHSHHYRRYLEPALGKENLPHAGYVEPAVTSRACDALYHGLRRTRGWDGLGRRGSPYVAGAAHPASNVSNYSIYAGYEGRDNFRNYYDENQAFVPRGTYY